MEEKTYEVTFVLEVTAENEAEAHQFAVDDIIELNKDGSLDGSVKKL